ncbi:MAG: formylglycine-generating enzyme family protein, partial [Deltaproteobacteria bacterium]|nr:formylglycine-generating enzyme family protein [Deltaproteobacteria bacterium]
SKPEVVHSKNTIKFLGMEFVLIKPGTFMMGSSADESGRDNDETQHSVTLTKKFYIQTTEVTQEQWRKAMKSNPSYFKDSGEDCPIESVSFDDCQEFIRKLNKQENTNKYRLPTEAEWEYACRAGSKTAFTNGDITKKDFVHNANLNQVGWYSANSGRTTHPVSQKKPNNWGLYDMHGNVWEWCQDRYGRYPDQCITDPEGPSSGARRVFKGGSWLNDAAQCRSANRFRDIPSFKSRYLGFRLVMTAP